MSRYRTLLRYIWSRRPWRKTAPGRHERPSQAVTHRGATLEYGAELRAMKQIEVAPELVSEIEAELAWGLAWHEFERNLQAEVDRIFAPLLVYAECETFDEVRELVGVDA